MEWYREIREVIDAASDIVDSFCDWNYSWHLPKDKYGYISDDAVYKLLSISRSHLKTYKEKTIQYEGLILHLNRMAERLNRQKWEELEDAEYWYPYYMVYQTPD